MSGIIEKAMFSGRSDCEGVRNWNDRTVEHRIPTYAESLRIKYQKEVFERPYMFEEWDLDDAEKLIQKLADEAEDANTLIALYAARACIKEEIRRRIREGD